MHACIRVNAYLHLHPRTKCIMFAPMETKSATEPAWSVQVILRQLAATGLSDAEVCRRAGIANTTLMRIKFGRSSPNVSTMEKIEMVIAKHNQGVEMKRAGESSV